MRKKLIWPGLPLLLLASILVLDVTMVIVATLDPPVLVDDAPEAGTKGTRTHSTTVENER